MNIEHRVVTWAPDLDPSYAPMSEEQAELFVAATNAEENGLGELEFHELDEQFLIQILTKRITAMRLPIAFTTAAKMAALALVDGPGAMVVLLVDCLNAYENETVTVAKLADLYGTGFYDKETLGRYIDRYMKGGGVRWYKVYSL